MKHKSELKFIKNLEFFLGEEFNEYSKSRIISYLKEYKEEIPPIVKHEIVYKEKIVKQERNKYKEYVTNDMLMADAKELCELKQVDINEFLRSNKSRTDASLLRKEFCNNCFQKYLCSNNILANFFGVHHSTISFYLYGKKTPYISITKRTNSVKNNYGASIVKV